MFSKGKNTIFKELGSTRVKKNFSFLLHEYQAQNLLKSFGVNIPRVNIYYKLYFLI
jgi:hypothetical protein